MVVGVFYLCWILFLVVVILSVFCKDLIIFVVVLVIFMLVFSNFVINLVFYGFLNCDFWLVYKRLLFRFFWMSVKGIFLLKRRRGYDVL